MQKCFYFIQEDRCRYKLLRDGCGQLGEHHMHTDEKAMFSQVRIENRFNIRPFPLVIWQCNTAQDSLHIKAT